jgi:putative transposase
MRQPAEEYTLDSTEAEENVPSGSQTPKDGCLRQPAHYRLWQRRFYPFEVFSERKFQQKLDYLHNNPVTRGLVSSPGDWPWSSWRFYYWEDASLLRMDRLG